MRKQLIENAAFDVAQQIRTVEEVIDHALAELSELQGRMLRANAVARIGVRTGQDAFQHVAQALNALVTARGGVADCHAALVDAKGSVPGLRTVSFGDSDECPPAVAVAPLRAVA